MGRLRMPCPGTKMNLGACILVLGGGNSRQDRYPVRLEYAT